MLPCVELFSLFETYACKSSFKILPFGPEPLTSDRLIPNSLANFLVAGPECTDELEECSIFLVTCFSSLFNLVSVTSG